VCSAYLTILLSSYNYLAYVYIIKFGPVAQPVWQRAGRSEDQISVGTRFSTPVHNSPGVHPASCTMGTGSFPGGKRGRGVKLITHPLLVPWSSKSRAIPLLPLCAVRPVQSLSACTTVHFIFTFIHIIWCLSVFTKFLQATVSFVMSLRSSAWNNSAPTGCIFVKFDN